VSRHDPGTGRAEHAEPTEQPLPSEGPRAYTAPRAALDESRTPQIWSGRVGRPRHAYLSDFPSMRLTRLLERMDAATRSGSTSSRAHAGRWVCTSPSPCPSLEGEGSGMEMGPAHADIRLMLWATLTPPSKPATIALTCRCRSRIVPHGVAARRYAIRSCTQQCIFDTSTTFIIRTRGARARKSTGCSTATKLR
jgi:hypothetical protein